ncbi:MAG: restriction endonuclease [Polyangiaceae bacterium]
MAPGVGVGVSSAFHQHRPAVIERAYDAGILLAGVVDLVGKTVVGDRIRLIEPAWQAILDVLEKDPSAAFQIKPRKWEELVAAAYDAEGFEVDLTPRSGDGGVDVIATLPSGPRVRIFDQVKAYGRGNLVPANDVRALMGVVAHSDATKGVVTTTSDFAPRIREDKYIADALRKGLELVNGDALRQRLQKLRKK